MIIPLPIALARYEVSAKINTLLIVIERCETDDFIREKATEILDELVEIEERYSFKSGVIVERGRA